MGKFNYRKWITENKYGIINEQTGSMTGSMSTGSMSTGSMSTGSVSPKPKPKRKKMGRLREQTNPIGTYPNSASFCPSGTDFNAQLCSGGFPGGANWGMSAPDSWVQQCCTGSLDPNPGDAPTTPTGQVMAMQPTGSEGMPTGSYMMGMPTGNMKKKSKKRFMKKRPTRGLKEQPSLMKRRAQMAKRRMPTAKTPQGPMPKGLREIKEFIKKQVKNLNEQGIGPVGPIAQGAIAKAVYAIKCDSTIQGLVPGVDYLPNVPGIQSNEDFGYFIGNLTVNGQTPQVDQVIYFDTGGTVKKWRIKSLGPATDSSVQDTFNVSCYHPLNPDGTLGNYDVGYNCAPLNPNSIDGCLEVPKYLGGNNPDLPNPDAIYNTLEDCIAAGCSSEGLDPCMSNNWVSLTQDQQDLFCSSCTPSSLAWHCPCCPGDGPTPIKSKGKVPMGKAPMRRKPMMENKKRNYKAFKNHIRKNFRK